MLIFLYVDNNKVILIALFNVDNQDRTININERGTVGFYLLCIVACIWMLFIFFTDSSHLVHDFRKLKLESDLQKLIIGADGFADARLNAISVDVEN